jgi:acyl-CoA thioesterase
MEILIENKNLMERKHFLIRAVANGNADEKESEKEIQELEKQIQINMAEALNSEYAKRSQEVQEVKIKAKTDGEMKRNVAQYFLEFMRDNGFDNSEIKGVFRQGYKISRYN